MSCEFDYCIYSKESICILGEIQIDSLGMCERCAIVTVPKEALEVLKNGHLKEIGKAWNNCAGQDNEQNNDL